MFRIQWAYNLAGIPSPIDSPVINDVSRPAAKRLIGTCLINKKEPIMPDMIQKLVEVSNLDNLLNVRNVSIFLLAFAVFSELRFFTLSMVILLFITLMLLSKLIEVRSHLV